MQRVHNGTKIMLSIYMPGIFQLAVKVKKKITQTLSSIYLNATDTRSQFKVSHFGKEFLKSLKHLALLQQTCNPLVSIAQHQLC